MAHATIPVPLSTGAETLARDTFSQLLWALSYPGRAYPLPGNRTTTMQCCVTIGQTLLDLETSFFAPDSPLVTALANTGARLTAPADAAYHFYPPPATPADSNTMLNAVAQAAVGTLLYPDQAATLIMPCTLARGTTLRLHGPGIATSTTLQVGGVPIAFWHLRAERVLYPLGWDLFLVDGEKVVGLPRTTVVEIVHLEGEN